MTGHRLSLPERLESARSWHIKRIRRKSNTPDQRVNYTAAYARAQVGKLPEDKATQLADKIVNAVLKAIREGV